MNFTEWILFIKNKCDGCSSKTSTCYTKDKQYCYECFSILLKKVKIM